MTNDATQKAFDVWYDRHVENDNSLLEAFQGGIAHERAAIMKMLDDEGMVEAVANAIWVSYVRQEDETRKVSGVVLAKAAIAAIKQKLHNLTIMRP
jgi:hypothetical protein